MAEKKYLLSTILVMVLILAFSITPEIEKGGFKINHGTFVHLSSYLVLSFFLYKTTKSLRKAIFYAGTYGVFMELVQLGIPYRNFELFDIITNYIGAGLILIPEIKKRVKKKV